MRLRDRLARPLLISLLVLALAHSALAGTGAELMPPGSRILSSDAEGVELELIWDETGLRKTPEGMDLRLAACRLEGEEGAPMLPRYRAQVALPPGHRAVLDWHLVASRPLAGEPLPFPTARALPDGQEGQEGQTFSEELVKNPSLFATSRPILAELGPVRRLRDLRVVELRVDPIAWDPQAGLRLATEITLRVRFVPEAQAPGPRREAPRDSDRFWQPIYRNAVLNGEAGVAWRERVPTRAMGSRGGRAEAALRLRLENNGLYGLSGQELITHGIPAGTSLAEIAVFRQDFDWDDQGQPDFEQIPVPRFFRDRQADGLLDGDDLMVFVGRELRYAEESPDSIEWYGKGAVVFVGVAPELTEEMAAAPGWEDTAGDYPLKERFRRHQLVYGENYYWPNPSRLDHYIDAPYERWRDNLYYFSEAPQNPFILDLPIESPGCLADGDAKLDLLWTGRTSSSYWRFFSNELQNANGNFPLPNMQVKGDRDTLYSETLPPGVLADGHNNLRIDRINEGQWFAIIKYWELWYDSRYRALSDSLFFHADAQTGPAEIRVDGLSRDRESWVLVRSATVSDQPWQAPVRIVLGPENQGGAPGNYSLMLRDQLDGGEIWWLADEASLRSPIIETPAALTVLDDPGPYDVLVITHDDFEAGMERWVDFRQEQGYRIKMLPLSEVWDAFFSGARGAIGLRNAARFAYQQWGTEFLLLVGDACKDARGVNNFAMPDFMPVHCSHENVAGANEVVALEEWVVKFDWDAWPSLMMGRLSVGSAEELEIILDKIECYEHYGNSAGCLGGGDWRKRFLIVADDCWSYGGFYDCATCKSSELNFELGQEAALELANESNVPGDIHAVPFFESVITNPWYEDFGCATSQDIQSYLRPLISPVFIDSLSQGYGVVTVQSHANRNQLGHEEYFKTGFGPSDHELLENDGMPFFWNIFGCHGNSFCISNEGSTSNGDCVGEKLLFLDRNRGAVASYASDGYEYLWPNLDLGLDLFQLMFWTHDPEHQVEIFPDWRLGPVLLLTELRYQNYDSSFRMNLLGDPLTRIDAAAPRVRLFVDGVEMGPDDTITVEDPSDTLQIEALILDEEPVEWLGLWNANGGDFPFAAQPAKSLDTTFPLDSLVTVDSLAAETLGRSRAWHMTAAVPFDFSMDTLVVEGRDVAKRSGTFRLPVAKSVTFCPENLEPLQDGQWVRAKGTLIILITVPHPLILPSGFKAFVDGALAIEGASTTDEALRYRIDMPYEWEQGPHTVTVFYGDIPYGEINLVVDERTRLLTGAIFPNPFRNVVTLQYELTGGVTAGDFSIYTLSGRLVHKERLDDLKEGENHIVTWDGFDRAGDKVANGVYLSRMVFTDLTGEKLVWEDKIVKMR